MVTRHEREHERAAETRNGLTFMCNVCGYVVEADTAALENARISGMLAGLRIRLARAALPDALDAPEWRL